MAAGASQMGASVVLIEQGEMGGDCLNVGCVPSKALLAAAHAAQAQRTAGRFGLEAREPVVDMARVRAHLREVIAGIAPMDSQERFEGLGVTVLRSRARFTGPQTVQAGETTVTARRVVVATGARPLVPPLPGLADGPYLTNETLFDLDRLPRHLIILGGGPIGCELAQAYRRLGAAVTVVEMASLLNREDPECADVVRRTLIAEGVVLREGRRARAVRWGGEGVAVELVDPDGAPPPKGELPDLGETLRGSHLLVALGRKPSVEDLGLEAAGVDYGAMGILADARLRTSNPKVFAIGDVLGGMQFTHVAGYHAGVVIKNALFRLPAKADLSACPRVTYTAPEVASVGLTEAEARAAGKEVRVVRWSVHENDRARAERQTDGLIKVVLDPKGRILGATIAAPNAGEMIQTWVLALHTRQKIGALATMIAPYPTVGEIGKRAAGAWYSPSLFSERTRKVVRFLARFG